MFSAQPPLDPSSSPPADPAALHAGRFNMLLSSGGWCSEAWADHLPRLLEPFGVRTWRVHSGQEATRVLQSGPVFHIAVVDLALPLSIASCTQAPAAQAPAEEEAGPRLLQVLARTATPPPTVVVKHPRSSRDDARQLAEALRLGAFACVDRPVDLELMLELFRRIFSRRYQNRWPGSISC